MPDERDLPHLKSYVSGCITSPFGIEWMRFDDDCPISDLIKAVPPIAFEVDNIAKEFQEYDLKIISEPGVPSEKARAAMINNSEAPIELMILRKRVNSAAANTRLKTSRRTC